HPHDPFSERSRWPGPRRSFRERCGGMSARPEQPEPFLRGCRFAAVRGVPYPRADARDFTRLPIDTWGTAQIPATVRLELVGDAEAVDIAYRTETEDLGYRGEGAGTTFAL